MDGSSEQPAPSPRRRIAPTLWFLALTVAGVFAAWQAHRFFWGPGDSRPPGRRDVPRSPVRRGPRSMAALARPEDLASDPLGAAGVRRLKADPTGVTPPAGAVFRGAFVFGGGRIATYEASGGVAAAADHYKTSLAAAGYVLAGDVTRPSRGRRLVFRKGRSRITVGLRTAPESAKIVRVNVAVIAPTGQGRTK